MPTRDENVPELEVMRRGTLKKQPEMALRPTRAFRWHKTILRCPAQRSRQIHAAGHRAGAACGRGAGGLGHILGGECCFRATGPMKCTLLSPITNRWTRPKRAGWQSVAPLHRWPRPTPVTWLTPDTAARVDAYFERELGAQRPIALSVRTLPSLRKRLGITLNGVFFRACRKAVIETKPDVLWLRSDKLAAYFAEKLDTSTPALVYEAHLVGELWAQDRGAAASSARKLLRIEQARPRQSARRGRHHPRAAG